MSYLTSFSSASFGSVSSDSNNINVVGSVDIDGTINVDTIESKTGGSTAVVVQDDLQMSQRLNVNGTLRLPNLSSDPVSGLSTAQMYFNTSTNSIKVYNGSSWVNV